MISPQTGRNGINAREAVEQSEYQRALIAETRMVADAMQATSYEQVRQIVKALMGK